MGRVYFSLGSNLGDRGGYLRLGVATMVGAGEASRLSRVYQTSPVGGVVQDDFWNLVLELDTNASPEALLARMRAAEAAALRVRTLRWGPRTLDVDLLWADEFTSDAPELTVPHPRWRERAFVLAPLAELRPDLVDEVALASADGEVEALGTLEALQ
jgi:2-amino-4-hydroxy-6-hydroxymethyldihydropteridine diphosphokinase